MARLPRLTLPGCVHHIIQRGNNRQQIFARESDYQLMLDLLREHSQRLNVAVHAYVLMGNHLHVLATPSTEDAIPQLMQAVGRRYVRLFNDSNARSGTLWEGRYRSTLVQTEQYLLACMAYIDLNPVRAGMVPSASLYRWSSHAHYIGRTVDPVITAPAVYWSLGNTPFARETAYAEAVHAGLKSQIQKEIGESVHRGWALGDSAFVSRLQGLTSRRVTPAARGRPCRKR